MSIHKEAAELDLRNKVVYRKLATPDSLCVRPLDLDEIKKMHSLTYRWHEQNNNENLQSAIDRPQQVAAGREQLQKNHAREFWTAGDDTAKQQRLQTAMEVGDQFQQMFPQFLSCEENTTQIVALIKQRNETFSLDSVIRAYQTLAAQGLVLVTPENCGLEGSEAVKGKMLINVPNWERVLDPVKVLTEGEHAQQRIAKMSADDYRKEFLPKDDTLPPIIQQRIEADILGFCKSHPEYDNENGTVGRDILLNWIRSQGMPINRDSLELSFKANFEALKEADCIFSEAPGIPVRAPGGISTLTDRRKPTIPTNERSVVIEEPDTAKRFSLTEILNWDSATMQKMMQLYPELENQINNM